MAEIKVTPELLATKANELRTLKADHDQAMAKMKALIKGLDEIWKGDAQAAYVAKFDSMQSTFTNFSEMIEGYAKLIDAAVKTYQEAEAAAKRNSDSFGEF